MKNTRKSLGRVIVCLRTIPRFLCCHFLLELLGGEGQITESPAGTLGIYSLVHRSLSDLFVPTHSRRREGLVLRRLLMPFRSHLPQ